MEFIFASSEEELLEVSACGLEVGDSRARNPLPVFEIDDIITPYVRYKR
jgi:hypothetical protein